MKTKLKLHLLILALLSLSGFAHAQGTAIGYQGRLNDGARPATGLYDFNFKVFDVEAGSLALTNTVVRNAVPTTNGVFSVSLDFGGVFTGAARWLEISVRTNGVGALSILAPRTPLLPTPYSIFAGSAGNVASGAITANQLNTAIAPTPGQFLSYNGGSLAWTAPGVAAGNIWSALNGNASYIAGNVGIGTTTPSTYGHGGTARILEVNNSGTTLHSQAHLMLYSGVNSIADSAMGSVTWAQPGGMAAYIGAQTRSTTPNAPSATLTFGTRQAGDGGPSPRMVITEAGNVGIGTIVPTAGYRLEVVGATILRPGNGTVQYGSPNGELGMSITPTAGNRADLRFDGSVLKLVAGAGAVPPSAANGVAITTDGNVGIGTGVPTAGYRLDVIGATRLSPGNGTVQFGSPSGEIGMSITPTLGNRADLRFDGTTLKLLASAGVGPPSPANGITINTAGNVSIGVPPTSLDPNIKLEVRSANGFAVFGRSGFEGVHGESTHASAAAVVGRNLSTGPGVYGVSDGGGYGGVFVGKVRVGVLEIAGGADLAEPFPMKEEQIEKGSVVVIDDEHPGRLRRSTQAYDTRVAGIVSGANGVNPGISLKQEGTLDQGENVSLTGRVYVQADASFGAIKAGDLLTTSATPGHAMKVTEHARSQGAILGKAMSALKDGRGMVLVLVTLQ